MSPLCGGVISADAMECVVSRSRFFALDCGCQIAVMGYITRRAPYQRRTFSTENWKDPMPASLPESNDPSAPPEIHRPVVFVIVCLAILMTTIDATIVATALDALKDGLDTTINWAGWTMTAYMFGFVLMLPITGVLTQRYGRRRVFIASVAMFTLTSVACGFAPDIYTLIAMRLLQAMGGAGLTPSATAIVVDYFGDVRDRATSLFGSMFPIGEIIGPVFGGIFVTYLTWSDIFFMNVPIGIFILLLAYRFIPPDPPIDRTKLQPFDYKGMLLLSFGLLTGMYATTMLGDASAGVQSPHFWVPLAASVVLMVGFVRHIQRKASPFVKPHMLYGPNFGAVNFFNAAYAGVAIGMMALVPLYAANRYGLSPLAAGLLLTGQGVTSVTCTLVVAFLMRRTGQRLPLFVGALLMAIGLMLVGLVPPKGISPQKWLLIATGIVGMGVGTVNPPSRNAGLQLEPESSSELAALRTMSINLGTMVVVAIVTATLAGVADPSRAQANFYFAIAAFMLLTTPMIRKIPEHHGAW